MVTIQEIVKSTYQITFDTEEDYDWKTISQVFAELDNFEVELNSKKLLSNNESSEKLLYWQDLFFMEVAEAEKSIAPEDNVLLEKIKTHPLYKENKEFLSKLPVVTTELGRELLIDTMIDNQDADELIPDYMIENALKKKSREDLREKLESWGMEQPKVQIVASYEPIASYPKFSKGQHKKATSYRKVKNVRPKSNRYKVWAAIAAVLIIGFFVWQPNKISDENLFDSFSYNDLVKNNINQVAVLDTESLDGTRGGDIIFKGLSGEDYRNALNSILLIREGEFYQAKTILSNLDLQENNQLLFYLSITQLNTNEEGQALENFKALAKIEGFVFEEDVAFQIAMLNLKFGKRAEAKTQLEKIIKKDGKYKELAIQVLSKVRWF